MELFSIHFWFILKTFPHDDIEGAHLQIAFRVVRDNEIEVSAVCKRKPFSLPPLKLCYYLIQFALYFEAHV